MPLHKKKKHFSSLGTKKEKGREKYKPKKTALHSNPALNTKSCLSAQMARSINRILETNA